MLELDRCFWTSDETLGVVHVPGCISAAIYGPEKCTCVREDSMRERLYAAYRRIERAERHLDWCRSQMRAAGLREFPKHGEI